MLRTSCARAVPRALPCLGRRPSTLGPALLSYSRTFSTGAPRCNSLEAKKAHEAIGTGSEGPHRHDSPRESRAIVHDGVTTGPDVTGDWVLFHPVYTPEELKSVEVLHNEAKTFSDKLAYFLVKAARTGFDIVSGYKAPSVVPKGMSVEELRKKGYLMDEHQWLSRILFLESIAGVPGMVAATLRHLRSLRLMKRDSGWIHTLLEEAENERMHLMTFMTLRKPSIWLRAVLLGAQGVFYNLFFFSYLLSPRACHRFVGYLEEEAVITYTKCIKELEAGLLPGWANEPAPEIAKDYWRLDKDAKLIDVIYAVRSDETTHRFVNHSLANLNLKSDINPFAFREPDMHLKGKKIAFERDEAETYVTESQRLLDEAREHKHTN